MEVNKDILRKIIVETINEANNENLYVGVGVSNKHIHLSQKDVDLLFGTGYQLTHLKDLKQPGQYACKECVSIVGPKGTLEKVRILGPTRKDTQVEISITDGFNIGVKPEICESGNLDNAKEVTILNPQNNSSVKIKAAIAALRHIHMPKTVATKYNFKDKEFVSIEINGARGTIFKDVLVRVSDKFELECHLDTDEANAVLIKNGDIVKVINS